MVNRAAVPASERNWQAEDDLRTLIRADEVRKDKKRYAAAKAEAKRKLGEMKSIAESK